MLERFKPVVADNTLLLTRLLRDEKDIRIIGLIESLQDMYFRDADDVEVFLVTKRLKERLDKFEVKVGYADGQQLSDCIKAIIQKCPKTSAIVQNAHSEM